MIKVFSMHLWNETYIANWSFKNRNTIKYSQHLVQMFSVLDLFLEIRSGAVPNCRAVFTRGQLHSSSLFEAHTWMIPVQDSKELLIGLNELPDVAICSSCDPISKSGNAQNPSPPPNSKPGNTHAPKWNIYRSR